ncbi:MAG: caspase family protein [SAR324 cluster bacterium]|nr:caspase family protein [SAR324 cluster bacterium]
MKPSNLSRLLLLSLFLTVLFAAQSLAQRDDRAVRVQGRQDAGAEQRVALVIGNSAYKAISPLKNPVNDAEDMATALRRSGFKVTLLRDATRKQMNRAIRQLGRLLQKGGVGLFYYAGHGVQVGGVNYLVPLGAEITQQFEVEDEAVSANRVLGMMEAAGNRLNMVFLDACRNNPYQGSFRAASQGLAAVRNAPKGSLISYATGAGQVAEDGTGRNGTYTKNLLRYIHTPGLELTTMMKRVRTGVRQDTRGRQIPYELSSLEGDFYFAGASVGSAAPATATVPKGPGKSKFSLGDFDKAARQEEASRNKWNENLREMKGAYAQVQGYERRSVSSKLKVGVWQRFLSAFTQDNPYTSEDDDLRRQAQARITHWQGEQQRVARLEADRRRREAESRRQADVRRRNREAEERRGQNPIIPGVQSPSQGQFTPAQLKFQKLYRQRLLSEIKKMQEMIQTHQDAGRTSQADRLRNAIPNLQQALRAQLQ